jgi:hypothetical protein
MGCRSTALLGAVPGFVCARAGGRGTLLAGAAGAAGAASRVRRTHVGPASSPPCSRVSGPVVYRLGRGPFKAERRVRLPPGPPPPPLILRPAPAGPKARSPPRRPRMAAAWVRCGPRRAGHGRRAPVLRRSRSACRPPCPGQGCRPAAAPRPTPTACRSDRRAPGELPERAGAPGTGGRSAPGRAGSVALQGRALSAARQRYQLATVR